MYLFDLKKNILQKYNLLCCSPDVDNQTHREERDLVENIFGNLFSSNDSKR